MAKPRFKHTGERLRQLQKDGKPKLREQLTAAAERDKGRSLTADEMSTIEKAVTEISNKPMYGG